MVIHLVGGCCDRVGYERLGDCVIEGLQQLAQDRRAAVGGVAVDELLKRLARVEQVGLWQPQPQLERPHPRPVTAACSASHGG